MSYKKSTILESQPMRKCHLDLNIHTCPRIEGNYELVYTMMDRKEDMSLHVFLPHSIYYQSTNIIDRCLLFQGNFLESASVRFAL